METLRVGIREFRENLATYLLENQTPVAVTRHGDTVGYYFPARRRRSEAEIDSLRQAAGRMQQMLAAEGLTEDEILDDFKKRRAGLKRRAAISPN